MNTIAIMGRLARDPRVSQIMGQNGPVNVADFYLVVKRNRNGKTFLVRVAAFGGNAAFCQKYLQKGTKILVIGELNVSAYQNPETGKTIYYTEIIMDHVEFAEPKKKQLPENQMTLGMSAAAMNGFVPANVYEDNPFEMPANAEGVLPFH